MAVAGASTRVKRVRTVPVYLPHMLQEDKLSSSAQSAGSVAFAESLNDLRATSNTLQHAAPGSLAEQIKEREHQSRHL